MKNFFREEDFGHYSAKIETVKGKMTAEMIFTAGKEIPVEIDAKFKKNGKVYTFLSSGFPADNAWIYDTERNFELFSEIANDWEKWCQEVASKFRKFSYVADAGALKLNAQGVEILIPNKIGDGEFCFYVFKGSDSWKDFQTARRFGFSEVMMLKAECIEFSACDVANRLLYKASGECTILHDDNGNFMLMEK